MRSIAIGLESEEYGWLFRDVALPEVPAVGDEIIVYSQDERSSFCVTVVARRWDTDDGHVQLDCESQMSAWPDGDLTIDDICDRYGFR